MPNGICPKCGVTPVVPKRSYCVECGREWQNEYKKAHPQTRTPEQIQRQNMLARERINRMTPEERKAHYKHKQEVWEARQKQNPEIRVKRNAAAVAARGRWSDEKLARKQQKQREWHERTKHRHDKGLCAYANCDQPPVGKKKICTLHWCARTWISHCGRIKPDFTADDLVALWRKQEGKCAILGVLLIPGETATLDHIVPVNRGGDGSLANVRFIHAAINRLKSAFTDPELKSFVLDHGQQLIDWAKLP